MDHDVGLIVVCTERIAYIVQDNEYRHQRVEILRDEGREIYETPGAMHEDDLPIHCSNLEHVTFSFLHHSSGIIIF